MATRERSVLAMHYSVNDNGDEPLRCMPVVKPNQGCGSTINKLFEMDFQSVSTLRALLAALAVLPLSAWSSPTQITAGDLSAGPGITHEQNNRVPEGAIWTEMYFPSSDGAVLHADVLRAVDLPGHTKTPVILSISSY